jgi:hypothetical protein
MRRRIEKVLRVAKAVLVPRNAPERGPCSQGWRRARVNRVGRSRLRESLIVIAEVCRLWPLELSQSCELYHSRFLVCFVGAYSV